MHFCDPYLGKTMSTARRQRSKQLLRESLSYGAAGSHPIRISPLPGWGVRGRRTAAVGPPGSPTRGIQQAERLSVASLAGPGGRDFAHLRPVREEEPHGQPRPRPGFRNDLIREYPPLITFRPPKKGRPTPSVRAGLAFLVSPTDLGYAVALAVTGSGLLAIIMAIKAMTARMPAV